MIIGKLKKKLNGWIKKTSPQLVILFGSTANGLPGPETDIDLAVLYGRKLDRLAEIEHLTRSLGTDQVDLLVLDHADPIARKAASEGQLLYEKEAGLFLCFISLAERQFMDNLKFRQARQALTAEFLARKRR